MPACQIPADADPAVVPERVCMVRAPGRLHLGFLDPSATLGRAFGSLGLVIDGFETAVMLRSASCDGASADSAAAAAEIPRALAHLHSLRARSGRLAPLHLRLLQVLPTHAGFGSGTQLALALGRAFCRWHGIEVETATIAQWLSRGRRSGIGICGFDRGGLLLDGGPGKSGGAAPLLSRLALPDAWRVLVVQDLTQQGLSGARELQAIGMLPPLPQAAAADICHQVLMRLLPGAADADFAAFAAGLNRMQQLLGAHFAAAQGGSAYTSGAVGQLLQWLAEAHPGQVAVGQSSWGPTGFAIAPDAATAQALVQTAQAAGLLQPGLLLKVVQARNHGVLVDP